MPCFFGKCDIDIKEARRIVVDLPGLFVFWDLRGRMMFRCG